MPQNDFVLDENGNVKLCPLIGYTAMTVADTAVLLALRYVESEEELKTMAGKQLQIALSVLQCQEIIAMLQRGVEKLQTPDPNAPKN